MNRGMTQLRCTSLASAIARASGQTKPATLAARPTRSRAGFTLLEVLVAVGAIAVVAAGLAVVFDSVGKTVSAGRRASRINQVGQLVKQQITADFGSMTRDGFLVIRQSYADQNGDDVFAVATDRVPVGDGESATFARPRRVDEILFFQNGSFASSRSPVTPGGDTERTLVAQAGEAMVYYGHGNLWTNGAQTNALTNVEIEGVGSVTGSYDNRLGGVDGLNAFAGDWVLVRKQVLLTGEPGTDNRNTGDYFDVNGGTITLLDGECQVAGQPAAASVYREMNRAFGPAGADIRGVDYAWYRDTGLPNDSFESGGAGNVEGVATSPTLASGTIDIATTSLSELRSVMENLPFGPLAADLINAKPTTPIEPGNAALNRMRLWMDNAMPTASADALLLLPSTLEPTRQARMRVALQPPGLLNNFDETSDNNAANRRMAVVSRSNRQMIAAGALITNCTEFVVEWSFGKTDAGGNIIWHGPPRRGSVVRPYDDSNLNDPQVQFASSFTNNRAASIGIAVSEGQIYGGDVEDVGLATWDRTTITSTFGFKDPRLDPNLDTTNETGPNPPRSWQDPGDLPGLLDWAWPSQIRVRISITDPLDPTSANETTFEYVFRTPEVGEVN